MVLKPADRSIMQRSGRGAVVQAGDRVVVDRQPPVATAETDRRWLPDARRDRPERVLGRAASTPP
ncbi:hypothetical protein ASG32_21050 [Methylobacterium sp. Leaf361]|uniref:hypothetical protein n=1 Tax=Methylobacterium sp. Leaf361 TaxID=1736352 RepID=UPI0006F75467|nr:hypothetical protein [Methylobacterium sp. Leaf361]KQS84438.1 hypothetical protein ASG32_21050 [Methylobacterium sp. Leaf361]